MNVKVNDSLTRVNISELQKVTKEKHKVDKNRESKKEIRRSDIERFLDMKVFLEVWVKVRKDWRDNENELRKLHFLE